MIPGMKKVLSTTYDEAIQRVPEALAREGFGVLTEIDVRDTLARKLGVEFRRYKILGACNPPLAHRALLAELEIGLMLPCNVIVYEDDAGHAVVLAIDPMETVAAHGNPGLNEVATSVKEKLGRVLASLG
jgi:uncharacterized protein (DUF302 family)